jgi:hypothetical protein
MVDPTAPFKGRIHASADELVEAGGRDRLPAGRRGRLDKKFRVSPAPARVSLVCAKRVEAGGLAVVHAILLAIRASARSDSTVPKGYEECCQCWAWSVLTCTLTLIDAVAVAAQLSPSQLVQPSARRALDDLCPLELGDRAEYRHRELGSKHSYHIYRARGGKVLSKVRHWALALEMNVQQFVNLCQPQKKPTSRRVVLPDQQLMSRQP